MIVPPRLCRSGLPSPAGGARMLAFFLWANRSVGKGKRWQVAVRGDFRFPPTVPVVPDRL